MKKTLLTLTMFAATISFVSSQNILLEDFELGALPTGWTRSQNTPSVGWEFGTSTAMSSQYWTIPAHTKIAASNDDKYDVQAATDNLADLDFLITPSMDFSLFGAVFMEFAAFFDGQYGSTAHIKVSTDGGLTWTNVTNLTAQSTWQTVTVDLSAYASNNDVKVAIHHNDNNDWASGFAVDDVMIFVPNNFDFAGQSITMEDYVLNTAQTIPGVIKNNGGITITSMNLNYQVDNGAVITDALSSLNIAPLTNYIFATPTQWVPSATGLHTIKVWSSDLNGNADQNTSNDTVTKTVYVANSLAQRKVLYEQFTSNTCGPCASSNGTISTFLNNNGANTATGKVVALKYHMNYPSPGTDAAYTAESTTRHTYYGVTGIPHASAGGNAYNGHPLSLTQATIDDEYNRPTIFEIDSLEAEFTNTTVTISGSLTSLIDVPAGYKLHVVVMENEINKTIHTSYTGSTTNQTTFNYVMRKMLPNANGTTLPILLENQKEIFDFTHTFALSSIFSTMNDISVVVFIQDPSTKEVYQAAVKKIAATQDPYDLSVTTLISLPDTIDLYTDTTGVDIEATVKNFGVETSSTFTLKYSANNTVDSTNITQANISFLREKNYLHPVKWVPTTSGTYTIKVWATNPNGNIDSNNSNDTISKTVVVLNTTGINSLSEIKDINIYPNPVNKNLNISFQSISFEDVTINVLDGIGRVIQSQKITDPQGQQIININVSDIAPGMYVVQLSSGESIITRKISVQH